MLVIEVGECRKAGHMKKILTAVIACMMLMCVSITCFASNGDVTNELEEQVETLVNSKNGTTIPVCNSENASAREGIVETFTGSFTSSGYYKGQFYLNSEQTVKLAWAATAMNGANASAIFRLVVDGQYTVYLPATGSAASYTIRRLPEGTHTYELYPYSNVSGVYAYAGQFYY